LRDRGTGRSLTPHRGLVRVDLVLVRGQDPADLLLVDPGDRVDLMDPAVPVVLRPLGLRDLLHPGDLLLVDLGDRVELMGRVALARRLAPVVLDRVELGPVDREALMARVGLGDLASRVVLVDMDLVDPVDPVQTGLADRVGLMSRVDPVDRAGLAVLDPVGPEALAAPAAPDLTGRAAQVDRPRRRTSNTVSTTGVVRSGAGPGTHRMDSARLITVHRRRRRNAASGGTMDLLLEVRPLTGTAHRLLAVGTGRRLLAAGTVDGTGPLAT
jgi:hypothetical protein